MFNFDFKVLAQKCLKPCVMSVLKLQFVFLNPSSKIPAGVRERTSKYPYMDICDCYPIPCHIYIRLIKGLLIILHNNLDLSLKLLQPSFIIYDTVLGIWRRLGAEHYFLGSFNFHDY